MDFQVKIRGFRVELGEIENRLLDHPGIEEAVVTAVREPGAYGGDYSLCAYVVPRSPGAHSGLSDYLRETLPGYMVPAYFIDLEELPLTGSGKIDRKALPAPRRKSAVKYAAPRDATDKKLLEIFRDALGISPDPGAEPIGIDENFFQLGGHSLKAIGLMTRVHKEFDIQVPLSRFFDYPTARDLARLIEGIQKDRDASRAYQTIPLAEEKEYYPLSAAQERFFIYQQMFPRSTAYHMVEILEFAGDLDVERFENSFRRLMERHESLRTSFHMAAGEAVQRISRAQAVEFTVEHRVPGTHDPGEMLREFVRPMDLSRAPLLRVRLNRVSERMHLVGVDMHHIISDGASVGIFITDFLCFYNNEKLPPLALRYRDYVEWREKRWEQEAPGQSGDLLSDVLAGGKLDLPGDYVRTADPGFEGGFVRFELTPGRTSALHRLVEEQGVTLYMAMLSIFSVFLSKLTNQESIVVGSPIAGRTHDALEGIIGLFINTLVLRSQVTGERKFSQFLQEVKKNALSAFENQDFFYEQLVRKLGLDGIAGDTPGNPLFNVMLVLQNMDMPDIELPGLKVTRDLCDTRAAKFDLALYCEEIERKLCFKFEYSRRLFKEETVLRYSRYFSRVIFEVLDAPGRLISGIEILPDDEKRQILYDFNDASQPYPWNKTIYQVIEEQVAKRPESTALIRVLCHLPFDQVSLTYNELNRESNRLARVLRAIGVGKGVITGIMLERSLEMIVAILAILKAGGAYLPIDPGYPGRRIASMMKQSGAPYLLTQSAVLEKKSLDAPGRDYHPILLDRLEGPLNCESPDNLEHTSGPEDLIYIIFTSGSTGKPKGAGVYHRGFMNLMHWFINEFRLNPGDRDLLVTSLSFDLTQKNLYAPLMTGGTLCIPAFDYFEPAALLREIRDNYVTWLNCTPSMFYQLVEYEALVKKKKLTSLRYVFLGGEPISMTALIDWLESEDCHAQVVNTYGPSECTDICASYRIREPRRFLEEAIPVGETIYNVQMAVLDKHLQLTPIGVPGELCIGGEGVGAGYIDDKELTARKFIMRSFEPGKPEEVYYRTGDLVKWLPDGNVEFLGRIDHQVKIRGFRIELGEIESQLTAHNDVKEAVVAARGARGGDRHLCAYIVPNNMAAYDETKLREHLAAELPDYMVPAYFVALEKMPLNPNGKVDRKALPEPERTTGQNYAPPGNPLEEKLLGIFQQVLGKETGVGIDDNFFQLGGHSLKAAGLISGIHKVFSVDIPIVEIFKKPTVRGIAGYIYNSRKSIYSSIAPVEKRKYYPPSPAQKRLYLLYRMDETGTGYNIPYAASMKGDMDAGRLEKAFNRLIQRHESLRTSFVEIDGEPFQQVHEDVDFAIEHLEAAGGEIHRFIKPFDLSRAPLLRVCLAVDKQILMVDMHHIISDGMSMDILVREFIALYGDPDAKLPALPIQYKDYAAWQNGEPMRQGVKKQGEYWLEQFAGDAPVLDLPLDFPRPAVQTFEGSAITVEIDKDGTQALKALALEKDVTLYMLLLSLYNILLARLSGREDTVVGTPLAGRRHSDLAGIIGVFINSLPLRNFPGGEKTFDRFLEEVKNRTLQAFENQDYPFEELVETLDVNRDASRSPVFDTMFVLQATVNQELKVPGLTLTPYPYDTATAKFDLLLSAQEKGEKLSLTFEYGTRLFKAATIERFIGYFKRILAAVIERPAIKISEIDILDEEEKKRLLIEFNDTASPYPQDQSLPGLFAGQLARNGDRAAAVDGPLVLTYNELNDQAGRLARSLRERGVRDDDIVALKVERSIGMITGILGILKAGGGYLPIDPRHPRERIDYMLNESSARLLLTEEDIALFCRPVPGMNPLPQGRGGSLAYVIYTSGTTGKPKGVLIDHHNVARVVLDTNYIAIKENDRILQLSNYAFDGSVFDIFGALLNGAALVMTGRDGVMAVDRLAEAIEKEAITVFFVTTALFNTLVELDIDCLGNTRKVLFGGERVSLEHARKALKQLGRGRIIHMYGPTEATVYATYHPVDQIAEDASTIPIGQPVSNTTLYILDKYFNPVPIGVSGEIYIGGAGNARGYLNNPELTAEKFLPGFNMSYGTYRSYISKTLYKTGDLARRLPDGSVEFMGRRDHQVKIRGFRIELGEIESCLLSHDDIKEAVVIIDEDPSVNRRRLCAYIVSHRPLAAGDLRRYLSERLPDYMIPSFFISLERIPLTPNGKVDHRALPGPEIKTGEDYAAPRDEIEEKLAAIWAEVLDLKRAVGIDDNFFHLGGHSLKAAVSVSRIHRVMGARVPLVQIFKTPTVRGLARCISETASDRFAHIDPVEEKEYYPVSSAQKRLYILQQSDRANTSYNMPLAFVLSGAANIDRLSDTFRNLLQRHESLRTFFEIRGGEPVQRIRDRVEFDIQYSSAAGNSGETIHQLIDRFVKPFDLSRAPLLRVGATGTAKHEHLLMIDMHHIISDGTSMGILIEEFTAFYKGKTLAPLRIGYKDFAQWWSLPPQREILKKQEAYWLREFAHPVPVLDIATDYPRERDGHFDADVVTLELPGEHAGGLARLAEQTGATLYMILLAVTNVLLGKLSGREDIVAGTPVAGRRHEDLRAIIGMFVNTLAIRNYPRGGMGFHEFLEQVRGRTLEAFENQDYPLEELVERAAGDRPPGRGPLFDVMFTLQNLDIPEITLPGLTLKPYEPGNPSAKFDLGLTALEKDGGLTVHIEYRTALFKKETIEEFAGYFKEIIDAVLKNKDVRLNDIDISTGLSDSKATAYEEAYGEFEF
jgi:tyrocidine synthetase-3